MEQSAPECGTRDQLLSFIALLNIPEAAVHGLRQASTDCDFETTFGRETKALLEEGQLPTLSLNKCQRDSGHRKRANRGRVQMATLLHCSMTARFDVCK